MAMGKTRRLGSLILALGIAATIAVGAPAGAVGVCADAEHAGGDWPSLNGTNANTRSQDLETTIGITEASLISPVWDFTPQAQDATGQIQSTPVVAEGCVYITTASGFVFALNADTGEFVWGKRYEETVADVCCGGTLFAPAVVDGVAYINVSHNPTSSTDGTGPYVLALDSQTGDVLWRSNEVASEDGAYTNSSAVYIDNGDDDLIFIGISNPEFDFNQTGGFALVDASRGCDADSVAVCDSPVDGATGGSIVKRTRTIPDEQYAIGMGGGSIWSTPAIDDDLYAYVGTGQPAGWLDNESEFVNAILKIDVDVNRHTFGEIVDVHKGTWDSEVRGDSPVPYVDVDFAASPTLFEANGQQMVAALQKSGIVHAAFTRHMTEAWSVPVSPYGFFLGNYASGTTDGNGNYLAHGTFPGQVASLNGTNGMPNWVSAGPTAAGANPLTFANGVVWLAAGTGVLHAYDAATGVPVAARSMSADVGDVCMNAGGGVAIARNTVYAVCGDAGVGYDTGPTDGASGWIVAYRLG